MNFLATFSLGGTEEVHFRHRPFVLKDPNANPAFLPFGSGARACVGQKFIIHGVVSLLASLLEQYEVRHILIHSFLLQCSSIDV